MHCPICGLEVTDGDSLCPGCSRAVASARPTRLSWLSLFSQHPVLTAVLCFFALGGILVAVENDGPPAAAHRAAFDIHDPLQFQDSCGAAVWRKTFDSPDGMSKALTIFYTTPSFGVGQTGVMVMFHHSKNDDPLGTKYSDVTFSSVPSNRMIDQSLALKMLDCSN